MIKRSGRDMTLAGLAPLVFAVAAGMPVLHKSWSSHRPFLVLDTSWDCYIQGL